MPLLSIVLPPPLPPHLLSPLLPPSASFAGSSLHQTLLICQGGLVGFRRFSERHSFRAALSLCQALIRIVLLTVGLVLLPYSLSLYPPRSSGSFVFVLTMGVSPASAILHHFYNKGVVKKEEVTCHRASFFFFWGGVFLSAFPWTHNEAMSVQKHTPVLPKHWGGKMRRRGTPERGEGGKRGNFEFPVFPLPLFPLCCFEVRYIAGNWGCCGIPSWTRTAPKESED